MEFVKLLLSQEAERAHFAADPDATLARHGLGELSPADVHDAVGFVEDTLTVDWAQAYGTGAGAAHPPTPEPGGRPGFAGLVGRRDTRSGGRARRPGACPRPPPPSTTRSSTPLTCTSGTEPLSHAP